MKGKETTPKIYPSLGQALISDTLNCLEITIAFFSLYGNPLNEWQKCSNTLLFFNLCKKVTINVWTTGTFFICIKKPGSTSLTANSQLNENILHKTGTEVLPTESLQPCACTGTFTQGFKPTLFMYLYKGFILDLVVTSISTKASGKDLEGQSSVEFYRYVQEVLVAKTKAGSTRGSWQGHIPCSKGKNSLQGSSESSYQTSPTCWTRQLFEVVKFNMQPSNSQPGLTPGLALGQPSKWISA